MRHWTLLAALAAAVLAPAAAAAPSTPAEGQPLAVVETFTGDLSVVGQAAAWGDSRCLSGCAPVAFQSERLALFELSRGVRRPLELARAKLLQIAGGSNSVLESVRFAASATHVVKLEQTEGSSGDQPFATALLFAGPVRTPVKRLFRCNDQRTLDFDLDGNRLAYDQSGCTQAPMRVLVSSLAGDPEAAVPTGDRFVDGVSLSGDFVAIADYDPLAFEMPPPRTGELSVWNWRNGTKVASTTFQTNLEGPPFDVATDGALAYLAQGGPCARPVNVLRPGDPAPTQLATGACGLVSWAGTEVITRKSDRIVAISSTAAERSILQLGSVRLEGFAEDDTRRAYALPTCSGDTTVHQARLDAPTAFAGPAACPVRIPRQRLKVGADRDLDVRLRCPRGCAGSVVLRRSGRFVIERGFELDGPRGSVSVRLPQPFMRRLLRRGRLRALVIANTSDRAGEKVAPRRQFTVRP